MGGACGTSSLCGAVHRASARSALKATAYTGCEAAIEWLFAQQEAAEAVASSGAGAVALPAAAGSAKLKLVLIVNTSLRMGTGKIASQCCHGASSDVDTRVPAAAAVTKSSVLCGSLATATLGAYRNCVASGQSALVEQWCAMGEPTVVVKADENTLAAAAVACDSLGLPCWAVRDAGRTQVERGSFTVVAVGPGPVVVVNRVTGSLKLL